MTGPSLSIEEMGVGAFLRRERQERGISLEEVANSTRIRSFYLEKIEDEEFGDLPSTPILRGFLRSYSNFISVDEEVVLRNFNRQVAPVTEDIDNDLATKIVFNPTSNSNHQSGLLIPIAAVVLFIFASGILLWFVRGKTEQYGKLGGLTGRIKTAVFPAINKLNGKKNGNSISSDDDTVIINGDASGKPVLQKIATLETGAAPSVDGAVNVLTSLGKEASSEGKATLGLLYSFAPGKEPERGREVLGGNLGLTIEAIEDTWLRLKVDNGETYESLLTAGSEKSWIGIRQFLLTVGNAAGTKVMLNGKAVTLPQTTSNVVRDFVISDEMLKLQQASSANSTE
jgi:cytoskeleton protein RodZ